MSSNCTIVSTNFLNDLVNLDSSLENASSRIEDIYSLIQQDDPTTTIWKPLFVYPANSKIENYLVSTHGYYENDSVGIQNFLTINNPQFHSWTTSNASMTTDWVLNKSYMPYSVYRGVILWYKSLSNKSVEEGGSEYGDALLDNNGNIKLIKNRTEIDSGTDLNYMLWIPDGDVFEYYLNDSETSSHVSSRIMPRTHCSAPLYKYYKTIYHLLTKNNIKTFDKRLTSVARMYKAIAKYLSSSPYIDENSIKYMSTDLSRFAEYSLFVDPAGFPDLLSNISEAIQKSLPNSINSSSPINRQSEIRPNLSNNLCLKKRDLFRKIISKYGSFLTLTNSSSLNYKNQLPHGASVSVTQLGGYWFNKNINDNSIITANQSITLPGLTINTDFTDKKSHIILTNNHTNPSNTEKVYLYNSVKPLIRNLDIQVVLDKSTNNNNPLPNEINNSHIFYWYQNIPVSLIELYIKLDYNKTVYREAEDPFKPSDIFIEENYINCTWEQASGPPMKFVNFNKLDQNTPINTSLGTDTGNNVKYGEDSFVGNRVYIFPSSTGRYQVKCNVSTLYGNFTIIKTFYVVFGGSFNPRDNTTAQFSPQLYGKYVTPEYIYNSFSDNLMPPNAMSLHPSFLIDPDTSNIYKDRIFSRKNSKNLRVNVPELKRFAVHRNGLFWPINTNFMVHQRGVRSSSFHLLAGSTFKFDFNKPGYTSSNRNTGSIGIAYSSPNAILKLDSIILENIRNNTDTKCKNCLSMYTPKLVGRDKIDFIREGANITRAPSVSYERIGFENNGYRLEAYDVENDNVIKLASKIHSLPIISTDLAPSIFPYGNYSNSIKNSIGLNIPNHPTNRSTPIAPITGYQFNYQSDNSNPDNPSYKQCIEETIQNTSYIQFTKGVFYPSSGWIPYTSPLYESTKNLSSVLKFNPGARDSFSFTGPSLNNLVNDGFIKISGIEYIIPKEYSSSIELSISKGAQHIPFCNGCSDKPPAEPTGWKWKNQFHTEFADQQAPSVSAHTHGYRILEGGNPKPAERLITSSSDQVMDEFGSETINGQLYNNRLLNEISYRFPVNGPTYPITGVPQAVITAVTGGSEEQVDLTDIVWSGLRDPRVLEFKINDIELKLNFLNYVNTKDISISFELQQSPFEKDAVAGSIRANNPYKNITNINGLHLQNNLNSAWYHNGIITYDGISTLESQYRPSLAYLSPMIVNYLYSLISMNSLSSSNDNMKLYLLNQEYIQNNSYNFSLTFTDHANKFNVLNDYSLINPSGVNSQQYIIQNNQTIRPTISASGFTDTDTTLFHSIMLSNKLYITNNTFNKFQNQILFKENAPKCPEGGRISGPRYSGKSKFICNIKIFDEHDDMNPIDNLYDPQLFTNFYDFDKQINSSQFTNSLCNWELLLHVGKLRKPTTSLLNSMSSYSNSDSLSLIEYGSKPRFPGYSFIADLTDKKHLLPFVNINAPYAFFQTSNLCEDPSNQSIGKRLITVTPRFPTELIVALIASTAALSGAGGLLGVLAGISGFSVTSSLLYKGLAESFLQTQLLETREITRRNIYQPSYDNYPFGSPEKILINFSKDNLFWYKAEASIFRYSNTPCLTQNKYNYMKLSSNICPSLANFDFEPIASIEDIIDPLLIKNLTYDLLCSTDTDASAASNPLYGLEINTFAGVKKFKKHDIVRVKFTAPGQTQDQPRSPCVDGLYMVEEDIWSFITDDPMVLMKSREFLQLNSILNFNINNNLLNLFWRNINRIVKVSGDLLYKLVAENSIINMVEDKNILGSNTVRAKALIYQNNKPYTILVLQRSLVGSSISPNNCVIVFKSQDGFNPEISSVNTNVTLSNNFCEKDNINFIKSPEIIETTNSLGSYGDGSPSSDKNIFYLNTVQNRLKKLNEILDNNYNDTVKYNQILINGLNLTPANGVTGYSARLNNIPSIINDIKQYISYEGTIINASGNITQEPTPSNQQVANDILSEYNSSVFNNQISNPSIIYLTNINTNVISNFGSITIQEDYVIKNNIVAQNESGQPITSTSPEFTHMVDRLNEIDNTNEDETLSAYVGKPDRTDNIIFSKKLVYMLDHYNALYDNNTTAGLEAKKQIEYAIRSFSKEKNDILKLLDLICDKKYVSITFKNTRDPITQQLVSREDTNFIVLANGESIRKNNNIRNITRSYGLIDTRNQILPQTIAKIKLMPNIFVGTSSSIYMTDIEYKDNDNYYWINLDPHQCCSIAEELRPRVLKSIKYTCNTVNLSTGGAASLTNQPSNNICARFADNTTGNNIIFTKGGRDYTYTIPTNQVQLQKTDIESRAGDIDKVWQTQYVERRYQINPTATIDNFLDNNELLINVIEEYEVLLAPHEVNNIITGRDADTAKLPGMGSRPCPDSSPGGFGLLTNKGLSRTEMSLRIYNICNLDNINTLKVQVRKIPRQVRGIDLLSTINRYANPDTYRPKLGGSLLDPIDATIPQVLNNNFYYWKCFEKDPSNALVPSTPPPIFQLMNEMMYRSFYGSADKIENKYEKLVSQFLWEIIPHEFFTNPPPNT